MVNKESSLTVAVISGIFVVIAACITGVFLLGDTLLEKGVIVVGPEVQIGNPQPESTISLPTSTSVNVPPTNSLCPMIVIEGTLGGLGIPQTKTWSELGTTTQEPQSVNLSEICSRNSDNQVQVWVGYWSGDPGYMNFYGTMTPDEAISLVRQNPNQPVLIVPWGE